MSPGPSAPGAASELLTLTGAATTGLATFHRCTSGRVQARIVQPDNAFEAERAVQASVVVHNARDTAINDVEVEPTAPAGWTVTSTTPTTTRSLRPDGTFTSTITIAVPADAELTPGMALTGEAAYRTRGGGQIILPIHAPVNGQLALACYRLHEVTCRLGTLTALTLEGHRVAAFTSFLAPMLDDRFELAPAFRSGATDEFGAGRDS